MGELIERLIYLLFVALAIRSALQFISRLWSGRPKVGVRPPGGPVRPAASAGPDATLLHQDPVCGTYVATDTSLKQVIDGKVVHFCSAECRDRYRTG
jgi:YHS domain-containing protein